ncbi:MAG: response regulator transcription factor [Candidatus Pseudobacter hemicellulosilyticus]|uniref:Response regulator transcription factor n=1 Tax=Candidatus Pseudobacter hemicellulosilyticus TaxID=3121375 RepID=A0AAJ6BI21_9BACT|nr:MAG: response regulator transcription factor [Pseudobacter sp.]
MKSRILFVEDEADLGNAIKKYFEILQFEVTWHLDGKSALADFTANPNGYDIVLLDVSMPLMDGFELAQQISRLNAQQPFLFLTARNERADKLHGLELGAVDYIVKPFDIDELVLRIKNNIRRVQPNGAPAREVIEKGDVKFYKDSLKLVIGEEVITLTAREADLLEFLFAHANRVVKRQEILTRLWNDNDYFLGRSLDVFIFRLRKYLSKSSSVQIANVYGVGFVLEVADGNY